MNVTVTAKDLNTVSNLTKAFKKARYNDIGGDELAALSACMYWIHNLEVQLKKAEPILITSKPKAKKAKKNVSKSKSR